MQCNSQIVTKFGQHGTIRDRRKDTPRRLRTGDQILKMKKTIIQETPTKSVRNLFFICISKFKIPFKIHTIKNWRMQHLKDTVTLNVCTVDDSKDYLNFMKKTTSLSESYIVGSIG